MAEYLVEIEGKWDLEQINLQISTEEAGASEFLGSSVTWHEGRVTNIAKFKELPPGQRPKTITLVKHGGQQPPNTKKVWEGVMVVSGTNEPVTAYRAT
ncbi:MAG: hypothetical protein FJ290_16135 [Planctomycetes bacterium]|nr:hypothetical protein [Planctomycetota bacterium]